ncbi:MAG: hypothetical protein WDZ36_05870 [Balneolaceae bacterium]
MIEYQLFRGDLLELFLAEKAHTEEDCNQICCSIVDLRNCENQEDESTSDLLDDDYYPIPIQLSGNTGSVYLLEQAEFYTFLKETYTGRNLSPAPPPPRPGSIV